MPRGLKWNRAHQLPIYPDVTNISRGSIHTVKKNREASSVANKENDLEVNTEKSRYIFIPPAGKYQNLRVDNK
jgi:hypothetical protein